VGTAAYRSFVNADDFVMGFEPAPDARQMTADLVERLAKFSLSLHEDKTRLILFGKLALFVKLRALQHVHHSKRLHLYPEANDGKRVAFP